MTRILTSAAGQQYAVDDEFEERLESAVYVPRAPNDDLWIEGNLADLLDFLTAEGMI